MGRRGPAPKPSALKELAGNPGKRALNRAEPKQAGKRPPCPKHLQGEAKKEWNRITRQLLILGLLTEVDRAALAAYCQCWARWVEAEEELRKPDHRMVTTTESGYPVVSPWMGIANQSMKQMLRFLAEFGMTPASRSRLGTPQEKEEDPFDEFLQRRSGSRSSG